MRRILAIAALALAPAVWGQSRTISPSIGPGSGATVCCSIGQSSSLGRFSNRSIAVSADVNLGHHDRFGMQFGTGFRHHHHFGAIGFPVYYSPYGYYPAYDSSMTPAYAPPAESALEDDRPGLTVFENRKTYKLIGDSATYQKEQQQDDRYGEHYLDAREQTRNDRPEKPAPSASISAVEPDETAPTILIYRDGHRRELHNYVVMGNSIYDMSVKPGQGSMKILIADLDLPATLSLNAERGVEFNLPRTR